MYYPILRNSASEMSAYSNLKDGTKDSIIPIIESKRVSSKNKATWWTSFNTLGSYLKRKLQEREFIYDFRQAYDIIGNPDEKIITEDKENIIEYCSNKMVDAKLNFIPCFHHDSPDWYITSIKNLETKKVAIRIRCYTFDSTLDLFIFRRIEELLDVHFTNYDEVILILDFFNKYTSLKRIQNALDIYSKFSHVTLILALTSCPANSDDADPMTFSEISPRDDINIYNKLVRTYPV